MNQLDRYAAFLQRHYRLLTIASLLVVFLLAAGLINAQFTSELRAYFSPDNPQLIEFQELESDYNKQDNIVFLVIPDDENVYTPEALNAIAELTELAWTTPYSRRVLSLTNLPLLSIADDEIVAHSMTAQADSWDPDTINQLKAQTLNDPLFKSVVNSDGRAAMIAIPLDLPEGELRSSVEVVDTANALRETILSGHPEVTIFINGTVYANYSIEQAVISDISILVPAAGVVIFILLMIILRVLTGTIIALWLISLTAIGTFGFFSWLGIPLTPVSGTIPTTLTVIAIADCLHLLITYYHELSVGQPKKKAVLHALKINFTPMFVTSLTTAIGLLCLNFSDSPPYRMLGNTVAFGAVLAFLLTVIWLPALLLWLPVPKSFSNHKAERSSLQYFRWMTSLGRIIIKHNGLLLALTSVAAILISINVSNNRIDDQWDKYFDDSFEITTSFSQFEKYFGGAHFIEFSAHSDAPRGIFKPEYMKELDAFAEWLRAQPEVGRVDSFTDPVKRSVQALHNNDPDYYHIPDDHDMISQAVLLYELSLPYGMSIEDGVNIDRSATKITAHIKSISSEEMIAFEQRARQWAVNNSTHLTLSEGTGIDLIFGHMAQRNSQKLLTGTLVALVLISAILIYVFRSLKLGLLSLVPNLIPIIAAYGIWGIMDGKIDLALSIIGALGLGIVVDDTVHFLAKYRHAKRVLQLHTEEAILYAFKTVGLAMVITTIVLTLGFLTLTLSHFSPSWNMGVLLPITISLALVFDFLLLPGLLIVFDKDRNEKEEKESYEDITLSMRSPTEGRNSQQHAR